MDEGKPLFTGLPFARSGGRGFHSSTAQLNLSRFGHRNHPTCPTESAHVEPKSGRV